MNFRILRSLVYNQKSFISSLTESNYKVNLIKKSTLLLNKQIKTNLSTSSKFLSNLFNKSITNKSITVNMSTEIEQKPKVVFVLGGPGAGKGTQCKKIVDKFGFVHLSAGDLLREERLREGSEYGELIEIYIKDGKIVPVEITCSLIEKAMNKNMREFSRSKFLIDGFPRNQDNLDGWERSMSDKVNLLFVLFFDCSEDTCIKRCLNRGQGGSGRSDDNLESLKKRIQTYENDSLPIINHFKELDLVRHIDASVNADEVFIKVEAAFINSKATEGEGTDDH